MKLPSNRKIKRLRRRRRKSGIRFVKSYIRDRAKIGKHTIYIGLEYYGCSSEDFYFACRFLSYTDNRFTIETDKVTKFLTWTH